MTPDRIATLRGVVSCIVDGAPFPLGRMGDYLAEALDGIDRANAANERHMAMLGETLDEIGRLNDLIAQRSGRHRIRLHGDEWRVSHPVEFRPCRAVTDGLVSVLRDRHGWYCTVEQPDDGWVVVP